MPVQRSTKTTVRGGHPCDTGRPGNEASPPRRSARLRSREVSNREPTPLVKKEPVDKPVPSKRHTSSRRPTIRIPARTSAHTYTRTRPVDVNELHFLTNMPHNDIFSACAYQGEHFNPLRLHDYYYNLYFTHIIRITPKDIPSTYEPTRYYLRAVHEGNQAWVQRYTRPDGRTVDVLTMVSPSNVLDVNQLIYARDFIALNTIPSQWHWKWNTEEKHHQENSSVLILSTVPSSLNLREVPPHQDIPIVFRIQTLSILISAVGFIAKLANAWEAWRYLERGMQRYGWESTIFTQTVLAGVWWRDLESAIRCRHI